MYEFVVCDDSNVILENIKKIINKVMGDESNYSVFVYNDYNKDFIKKIDENDCNRIYILDIETKSASGIDIARKIRRKDKVSTIIFLSSHEELGNVLMKSQLNFLTFVSKFDDYKKNLYNALKETLSYKKDIKQLKITENFTEYTINHNNILYICKNARKTMIKTDANEYGVYLPMSKIIELLGDEFVQVHKSCYVNKKRVESINYIQKEIKFDNGISIDLISRKYGKNI